MATSANLKVQKGRLTLAQVNANTRAGTVIVPAMSGRALTVVDAWFRAIGGNAGGATAVILTDTATSPTTVVSTTVGTLTQDTLVRAGVSGSTATNLLTPLTKHKGLRIGCTVGDLTTCTDGIDYVVKYVIES